MVPMIGQFEPRGTRGVRFDSPPGGDKQLGKRVERQPSEPSKSEPSSIGISVLIVSITSFSSFVYCQDDSPITRARPGV